MKKIIVRALFAAACLALIPFAVQAEVVRVGGGGAAMATIFDQSFGRQLESVTGITITRRPSTPVNGLMELVGGTLDLASAAVPLESMISGAAKSGVTVDPAKLQTVVVGVNKTVLFVNPANKVEKLSREQVKGIFTGKITSWKEVGGDDAPILVVWGAGTSGQNALFIKDVLNGAAVTKDTVAATNYASIKEIVASTPEAVGIDPYALADSSVKVIHNDPELTSPIIAVTLGKPSASVQKMLDYIKGDWSKQNK